MEDPFLEYEPPFRWRRLDLLAFGIFFAMTVVFVPVIAFVLFRLFEPGIQIQNMSGVHQILMQAFMDFALVAFIFYRVKMLYRRPFLRALSCFGGPSLIVFRMIAAGVLLAVTVLIISALLPAQSEAPLEKLLTTRASLVVFVIFGIAFAPLMEEIIFRGFLYAALADVYGSDIAVPLTAVLFAVPHFAMRGNAFLAVLIIFLVGYIFTIVRQRSGSVIPSIIMHTAYNATIFLIPAAFTFFAQKTTP